MVGAVGRIRTAPARHDTARDQYLLAMMKAVGHANQTQAINVQIGVGIREMSSRESNNQTRNMHIACNTLDDNAMPELTLIIAAPMPI